MNKFDQVPFYRMAEFWIAVVDAVVAITLQVLNLYASSEVLQLAEFIIAQLQPLVIIIIGSLFAARLVNVALSIGKLMQGFKNKD